jgi:glycerol kinase
MARLISVIDAGTNKVRFVIFQTPNFEELCSHEVRIKQISPATGHLEHDPKEIIEAVRESAKVAIHLLANHGYSKANIACVGVTNQRETVVLWDKVSGEPLHNAVGKMIVNH